MRSKETFTKRTVNRFLSKDVVAAGMLAGMLTLAAGCQAGGNSATTLEAGPVEDATPIQMMLIQNDTTPPAPTIVPELERLTGTRLDLTWVPDSIYSDKMAAAISSGSVPDVLSVKAVDQKHPSIVNGIRSGLFWEIGPYLSRFPNLKRYMNADIMRNASYFGRDYGLYWERPLSRQGIQYRKDWLERLGLSEPRNVEELYTVLQAFTLRDPDGNGKQDTYGLLDRNDLVFGAFKNLAVYMGAPNGWGLQEGQLIPDFLTMEYRDAMRFMRRLYVEGILNPDFAVTSKVQQEERFVRGEGGMMMTNLLYPSIQDRLRVNEPEAQVGVVNRIRGPQGDRVWAGTGYAGIYVFPKASVKTEEKLLRILAFFDRTLEGEANNLITYGIQGRHYSLQINGTVKVQPETKAMRAKEVEPYTNTLRIMDVRVLKQGEVSADQSWVNERIADNAAIAVPDLSASLISTTQAELGTELSAIITDATYRFIMNKLDEAGFDRELELWMQSGGTRIIEEMNRSYEESYLTKD